MRFTVSKLESPIHLALRLGGQRPYLCYQHSLAVTDLLCVHKKIPFQKFCQLQLPALSCFCHCWYSFSSSPKGLCQTNKFRLKKLLDSQNYLGERIKFHSQDQLEGCSISRACSEYTIRVLSKQNSPLCTTSPREKLRSLSHFWWTSPWLYNQLYSI